MEFADKVQYSTDYQTLQDIHKHGLLWNCVAIIKQHIAVIADQFLKVFIAYNLIPEN